MSDVSDDTNHLLLIPPDFFMADLANDSAASTRASTDFGSSVSKHVDTGARFRAPPPSMPTYTRQHPPPPAPGSYAAADASSFHRSYLPQHYSTPKVPPVQTTNTPQKRSTDDEPAARRPDDRNVIVEIDKFLDQRQATMNGAPFPSPERQRTRELRIGAEIDDGSTRPPPRASLFASLAAHNGTTKTSAPKSADAEPLLSLSEMWSSGVAAAANSKPAATQDVESAERVRREHCERIIQLLQQQLLDAEQRNAVALRCDRRKDEALQTLRDELTAARGAAAELQLRLDQAVQRFADEHQLIDARCAQLQRDAEAAQRELAQSQAARTQFAECNGLLEQKLALAERHAADGRAVQQQHTAELQVRVRNAERMAELATAEMAELRGRNGELVAGAEKWREREQQLLRELDAQRATLKNFYQQQLNEAVARKVADFQLQCDRAEAELRLEARERERLLAERAMAHVELLVRQNEQECALLGEKYAAEMELQRCAVARAQRECGEWRREAAALRARRADMAERLHSVMETQWQRAQEILTVASPERREATAKAPGDETATKESTSIESLVTRAESDRCETPTTPTTTESRTSATTVVQKGMSKAVVASMVGDAELKADRLQHYIEMLLEKSPRDVGRLRELLAPPKLPNSADSDKTAQQINTGSNTRTKLQPWK